MTDTTQDAAIDTLFPNSSGDIAKQFTMADASSRLSTVSNILNQKFGPAWKIILILILILIVIAFIVILFLY